MRFHRAHPVFRTVAMLSVAAFLTTTLDLVFFARPAYAADARDELTRAEDYFLVADFSTALAKVNALLDGGGISGGTLRDAYILKARCEVGLAHRSSAVEAFCQALRVESSWRPDPDLYTKDELEVFEQAKTSCGAGTSEPSKPAEPSKPLDTAKPKPASSGGGKPWYKKPAVLAVGGALVVGGVVLAMGGGGDDGGESDLPFFPEPPQ